MRNIEEIEKIEVLAKRDLIDINGGGWARDIGYVFGFAAGLTGAILVWPVVVTIEGAAKAV